MAILHVHTYFDHAYTSFKLLVVDQPKVASYRLKLQSDFLTSLAIVLYSCCSQMRLSVSPVLDRALIITRIRSSKYKAHAHTYCHSRIPHFHFKGQTQARDTCRIQQENQAGNQSECTLCIYNCVTRTENPRELGIQSFRTASVTPVFLTQGKGGGSPK